MPRKPAKDHVEGQNEHIFPASHLTPLAIQWKQLTTAGRHKEAMLILEQIVVDSTAMFERLAQYENFHYTVDLPILVSAAQEKVIKWLAKWQPKKGKLFSWFSLHADTLITLEDGTARKISELVRERYSGKVLCWNTELKRFEARQVTDWSEEPCRRKDWRKLVIKRPSGYSKPVYITHEHRVWTQSGWKQVDHLIESDRLFLDKPTLTAEGQEALIGLYLGDGSILQNDFRTTHGKDQRFYNEWLCRQYRGRLYNCNNVGWNSFTDTVMDHTGETIAYFHAADMWDDFKKLQHPKKIDAWVLERLSPLGLAVWYMDDGSYFTGNGAVTLATMSFTLEEREALRSTLKQRFGVDVSLHKNKGLYVQAASRSRFFKLVAPHVLREFDYKLDAEHRRIAKISSKFVFDRIEQIDHISRAATGSSTWKMRKRFKVYSENTEYKNYLPPTESFNFKYDLTVEGAHNFFAGSCKLLVSNSKCAKNAFRSELVKVNQYRKRYHVTSDNLEKFYGAEDHEVDKHDLATDMHNRLRELTCRWGDPQEIGAIRFLTLCIIDEEHDKQAAIRSAAYAYCISFELAKFFYVWSIVNLRHAFYEKVYVPFTEHDLLLAAESYSLWPELVNIVGIDKGKEIATLLGGQRMKIPSLQYISKLREEDRIARDIENSDGDPDAIAEVARKHKKTPRNAVEIFNEMTEIKHPKRYGEHSIFGDTGADE